MTREKKNDPEYNSYFGEDKGGSLDYMRVQVGPKSPSERLNFFEELNRKGKLDAYKDAKDAQGDVSLDDMDLSNLSDSASKFRNS